MRKSLQMVVACLAFVLPLNFPASGQSNEKKYRFEFFGGANVPFDKDFEIGLPQSEVIIHGTHKFSPGPQGGVRLGIDGARYWGQDYAYSYGENTTKLATPFGSFSFKNKFHQASSNLLFYPWSLGRKRVFPYITAGVGATFVVLKQNTITEALSPQTGIGPLKGEIIFAFNTGLGVRFRLSERVGIRIDGRDYMSRPLRYGLPKSSSSPNTPVLPTSGVFHQVAGTVGVVIHF